MNVKFVNKNVCIYYEIKTICSTASHRQDTTASEHNSLKLSTAESQNQTLNASLHFITAPYIQNIITSLLQQHAALIALQYSIIYMDTVLKESH